MTSRRSPVPAFVIAAAALLQGCIEYVPVQTAAQQPPPPAPPGAPAAAQPSPLERLVGPIALYPDPLLALVLPASTVPSDISAARAYLVQYGDLSRLDSQPWDPSVRALARYPSVIQWLDENQEWTRALGQAFLDSPRDVMDAIQRLRREAVASGALASNFLQQEYSEDGQTGILPGQADGLYVPVYDSDAYFWGGNAEITYSGPYPVGPWLSYWPDWIGFGLWTGGWDYWHGGGTWHPPHVDHRHPPPGMHPWPQPVHPRKPTEAAAGRSQNYGPAPHPMRGATVSAGHSAGASHFAPASHFEGSHASAPASAPASPSSSTSSQDSKNH